MCDIIESRAGNTIGDTPEMAVIIISVGAPPELADAIGSVLRQDLPVELILVNSGGGDVRRWLPANRKDIRIVETDDLWGPGKARNEGVEASRAAYVSFLAADCQAMDGWVRRRLAHHREGAMAVASAVVNSHPLNIVAWASHLALFSDRFPGMPAEEAARYGGSYDRRLFVRHGPFEDIRVGEDTEFHQRIGKRNAPKWVPEVRTVHRNVTSIPQGWRDQHRRGLRSGKYWPGLHGGTLISRVRSNLFKYIANANRSLTGRDRFLAMTSVPLLAINLWILEKAANRSKLRPDRIASLDAKARRAANSGDWEDALRHWKKSDSLKPGRFSAMAGRAKCLMRMERYRTAEIVYTRLRDAWPEHVVGHAGVGEAAKKNGAPERALEAWRAVASISPDEEMPKRRIASTLLELGRMEEAAEVALRMREQFPAGRAGFALGAEAALRQGNWEAADSYFSHLVFGLYDWKRALKWANLLVSMDEVGDAFALWDRLRAAGAQREPFCRWAARASPPPRVGMK